VDQRLAAYKNAWGESVDSTTLVPGEAQYLRIQEWRAVLKTSPLELLSEEMLNIAGLNLETTPDGLYVDVPFTADTLPDAY
jgi:hypothetical protein